MVFRRAGFELAVAVVELGRARLSARDAFVDEFLVAALGPEVMSVVLGRDVLIAARAVVEFA